MEDGSSRRPLLSSDSTGAPKVSSWFRQANVLATGDVYEKAAALVDLAEDGEGMPPEVLEGENSATAINRYFIYTKLSFLWSLNLAALIMLTFFEVPLWCTGNFPDPCGSKAKFFLGDLPYLPRYHALGFEVIILLILIVHTLFPISFLGTKMFFANNLTKFRVVLIVLLIGDAILNTIYISPSGSISVLPVRFAPYIRVILVASCISHVRESIKTLVGIIPDFSDVAALLVLFLLFSSWLAYVLFEDTIQGDEVFTSFLSTVYEMTVLFTTSNNPEVWLPAYKQARISCVFFIIYILIGVFFITNLVLAVVYDSFKGQLAASLILVDETRNNLLQATFKMIDVDNKKYLDVDQCKKLFIALNNYRTLPKIPESDMDTVFFALDDSGDFQINKEEFFDLCTAISLKFDKSDEPLWLEGFPGFYESPLFIKVRNFVKSKKFEYIVIGMLTLNLITVIIETSLDLTDSAIQTFWQSIEFAFGWIYLVELTLKVMVYGFTNYWRSSQNRFDFFITWIIVILETWSFFVPTGLPIFSNADWIRYLLIARLLRLIRVLLLVERFRLKLVTFMHLVPNLLPYLGVVFFLMCVYASIGVQAFGGLVYEGNVALVGTPMEEDGYFWHNFNDYPTAMVTLFNLLVMGNWQTWLETYAVLSNQWLAVVYFMSFYVLAVLFVLNLIVGFVLEAWFAEIEIDEESKAFEKEEAELAESERRGNDPTSEKARRRARRGKDQRVQNLLSHMLEAEMQKSKESRGAV